MDEYRFNSGSDLQIGRALEEINSWYYRGMGDFDIKRCQMWFNDNTACRQIYIVRIMYDLIKCDVYRFVVKADGSGMIDYIEFDPEFNEKAKRIAEFVQFSKRFYGGIKISSIEELMEHRHGGGEPVKTIRLYVLNP